MPIFWAKVHICTSFQKITHLVGLIHLFEVAICTIPPEHNLMPSFQQHKSVDNYLMTMALFSRFGICLSSMFYRSRTGISSCKNFDVIEAHLSLLDVPIKVCFAGHIQPIRLWDNRRLEYIKGDGSKRRQVLMILISFKTYQQWFRLGRYNDHQVHEIINRLRLLKNTFYCTKS